MFFNLLQWCNFSQIEALKFLCIYTHIEPATTDVFPVVANMYTKSIQKQIIEYHIKSKYPEEFLTCDKVGSENLKRLNPVLCRGNCLLISYLISKQSKTEGCF